MTKIIWIIRASFPSGLLGLIPPVPNITSGMNIGVGLLNTNYTNRTNHTNNSSHFRQRRTCLWHGALFVVFVLSLLAADVQYGFTNITIEPPSPPPLKIGLERVSVANQAGLVGRCADNPLIVRAFNFDNPTESIEGIPLLFEIIQGGGIFTEQSGYSTVSNVEGKGALHYHYGTALGSNKVKVSVLGDTSVTPVEFTIEGYLPEISFTRIPNLVIRCIDDALDNVFKVKVRDPRKNIPLKDIEVKSNVVGLIIGTDVPIMLPESQLTDSSGEATFGFAVLGGTASGIRFRFYLPEFIDPATNEPLKIETGPLNLLWNEILFIVSGQAQIGVASQPLANPLIIFVGTWDGATWTPLAVDVTFTVKYGDGQVDGSNSVIKPTIDGYASVNYKFGQNNEPQIVEVTESHMGEQVYFVAGPPEMNVVTQNELWQYVRIPSVMTTDPAQISTNSHYQIEVKAPINKPPTLKMTTANACGNALTTYDGAIGNLNLQNIPMQWIEANERYAIYRTPKRLLATTKTLLPGEVISGDPAPGYDLMQMTPYGSLTPAVSFSPEETRIKIRRLWTKHSASSGLRELIYKKGNEIELKADIGSLELEFSGSTQTFEWDIDGNGTIDRNSGRNPYISIVFTDSYYDNFNVIPVEIGVSEIESDRRKTITPRLTTILRDSKGQELKRYHTFEPIRVALNSNIGYSLPVTQETLDNRYNWASNPPCTFDPPSPNNVFFTKKLVFYERIIPDAQLTARGATYIDWISFPPKVFGVYITPEAWKPTVYELDGTVEHERRHAIQWAERRDGATNVSYKLWKYLYDNQGTIKNHFYAIDVYDHAFIYYDYCLASSNYSHKVLSNWQRPQLFTRLFNKTYRSLINGEKIDYKDTTQERRNIIAAPAIVNLKGNPLYDEIKTELISFYNRITASENYPELKYKTEFDTSLQLINPFEE